ncbi:SRPBCC family protein [Streptomyces sp. AV19]|uniref:SRPBCC family protein n=1 Tax=Streptomyces sp. AV19 TaxID=2793068 RepID=UPI0018FEEBC3|nr:SRPBCC family protein [Streptomyces sp. AV19]MBH1937679.1 SRPBCC family protein [Streptomyces sp. AV19]MDG4536346.1 SRPBCC family protein [Streptomyces sp. AV19]
MPSMSGAAGVYIDRPPEAVFGVLADPDNWPEVNRGVTLRTTRVHGDPSRPLAGGDVFVEHAAGPEGAGDFEFPWNVQESTPNTRLIIASRAELGPGHHCFQVITFEFAPSGPGTAYTRTIRVDFPEGTLEAASKDQAGSFQEYMGQQYTMAMKLKAHVEGQG